MGSSMLVGWRHALAAPGALGSNLPGPGPPPQHQTTTIAPTYTGGGSGHHRHLAALGGRRRQQHIPHKIGDLLFGLQESLRGGGGFDRCKYTHLAGQGAAL